MVVVRSCTRFRLSAALVVVMFMIGLFGGCSSDRPPNLFDRPTLTSGKTYRYRIPIDGCAEPIVRVNGHNWEPETPWSNPPYPKRWKVTSEGTQYHKVQYLDGTVRLDGHQLIIGLPDGTVVKHYRETKKPQALCA